MILRVSLIVAGVAATVALCVGVTAIRDQARQRDRLHQRSAQITKEVHATEDILAELIRLESQKLDELLRFAEESASDATSNARMEEDASLASQREIVAALDSSLADFDRFSTKRANASFDRLLAAHSKAEELQRNILAAQLRALGILSLQRPDHPAVAAQQKAREAQIQVGAQLQELADARDMARGSRLRTPDEQEYEHHTYHVARAERYLQEIPRSLTALANRDKELEAMESAVTHRLPTAEDEDAKQIIEGQLETVRKSRAEIATRVKAESKLLGEARSILAFHRPKMTELEGILDGSPIPPPLQDQIAIGLQRKALALQKLAIEAQASASSALGSFPPGFDRQALVSLLAAHDGEQQDPESSSNSYSRAVALEQLILRRYHMIRAMEKAMVCRMPLDEALCLTEAMPEQRPALSPEDESCGAVVESIASSAASLCEQARRIVYERDDAHGRGRLCELMERFAIADQNDPARDLTPLWSGAQAAKCGLLAGGPNGPPALNAGTVSLPAFSMRSRELSLPNAWFFVDRWDILGPFDNRRRSNIDTSFAPENVMDLHATYSGKDGVPIEWEPVRSEGPNVMPPFTSFNSVRKIEGLSPEVSYLHNLQYTVYYAYTELNFDQPCDRWLAIGSDDFSRLWLNDQPVWTSGKKPKAWKTDEGYRKVHFKAGTNRLLFRIENGQDRTEFSVLVGLHS